MVFGRREFWRSFQRGNGEATATPQRGHGQAKQADSGACGYRSSSAKTS